MIGVLVVGLHLTQRVEHVTDHASSVEEEIDEILWKRNGETTVGTGRQPSLEIVAEATDGGRECVVVENSCHHSDQSLETTTREGPGDRVTDDVLEAVRLVDDHDLVFAEQNPVGGDIQTVEVSVDDHHVDVGGSQSGRLGEAG